MAFRLGHRPALDGVRCLAIVPVMLLHADARLAPGGAVGVDLFFVLSAFLISSLIMEEVLESGGPYCYRAFYWRRGLRLGPALVLWLMTIAPATAIAVHEANKIPSSTVLSALYVGDFGMAFSSATSTAYSHVWSLAVEEQFYLLWPVALVLLMKTSPLVRRRALLAFTLLAFGTELVAAATLGSTTSYFLPTGHVVPLMIGCLLADLMVFGMSTRLTRLASSTAVAVCSMTVYVAVIALENRLPAAGQQFLLPAVTAAACAVIVVHAASAVQGIVARSLTRPPLQWLGKRSYGLYLYHRSLAILIPAVAGGLKLRFAGPLAIVVSVVVAALSYRFIERPIQSAGRRRAASRRTEGSASSVPPPVMCAVLADTRTPAA